MALNKTGLKAALIAIFTSQYAGSLTTEQTQGIDNLATGLSNALDTYVKSGTINTTVTVTSVAGVTPGVGISGSGLGTGTGTIA